MTTTRLATLLGLTALTTVLLTGCFGPAPVPVTDPQPGTGTENGTDTDPSAGLVGTTWYTDGSESATGCEGTVTFLADGTFDYTTKCADETDWREYSGAEDNSFWLLEGDVLTLSYNDGYNVCEGPVTADLLDLHCVNQAPSEFDRVFVPA